MEVMRWRSSDEMLGVEIPRCRDAEVQQIRRYRILLRLLAACAGDTLHRATPPYGWRVLGV